MPPKKAATKTKRTMSAEHKTAIAEGRKQAKAVADYLEALAANKPKRGRQRTPDTIKARLAKIDGELAGADALTALNLEQEKLDLAAELDAKSATALACLRPSAIAVLCSSDMVRLVFVAAFLGGIFHLFFGEVLRGGHPSRDGR